MRSTPAVSTLPPELAETAQVAAGAPNPHEGLVLGGRFRVGALLGEGGMGVVYDAVDLVLDRPVAVKVLRTFDATYDARFFTEAKIIAQLSSNPHVVTIYDLGRTNEGQPFLVMERLAGRTLRSIIETSRGGSSRTWVCEVGSQICAALFDAHTKGVVHRDLKPENVFVLEMSTLPTRPRTRRSSPAGYPLTKVLDFGIARSESVPLPPEHATKAGSVPGTPAYLAPEVIRGEQATPAADVYALGIIFYELATGAFPYKVETPFQMILAHASGQPLPWPEPDASRRVYPPAFRTLVYAALEKSPAARPTIKEIWATLAEVEATIEAGG